MIYAHNFRGLHFIYLFIKSLMDDFENQVEEESLISNCKFAYEKSLKPYHNIFVRQTFSVRIIF